MTAALIAGVQETLIAASCGAICLMAAMAAIARVRHAASLVMYARCDAATKPFPVPGPMVVQEAATAVPATAAAVATGTRVLCFSFSERSWLPWRWYSCSWGCSSFFWAIFYNVFYAFLLNHTFLRSSAAERYYVLPYDPIRDASPVLAGVAKSWTGTPNPPPPQEVMGKAQPEPSDPDALA
mmetsp:Transcript_8226/g.19305  ORF Transcript_8226/g.19305 Transcript_8226/m.19305 type:complete len:182 (-) Transcript_8226:145-690(-)